MKRRAKIELAKQVLRTMTTVEDELRRCGLYEAAALMSKATQRAGYELAWPKPPQRCPILG